MHPNSTLWALSQRGLPTARQGSQVLQEWNRRSRGGYREGAFCCPTSHLAEAGPRTRVLSLSLNLGPRGSTPTAGAPAHPKGPGERWALRPEGESTGRGADGPARQLDRARPGEGRRQVTAPSPPLRVMMGTAGARAIRPTSYPGRVRPAAPVSWQPRAATSKPGQVAAAPFRAHGGPEPEAHGPGLWVLP